MTDKQRGFIYGLVTAYFLTGFFLGFGMARNIPAMNMAGVAYYALLWPGFIATTYGAPAPYIPAWTFTYDR